MAILLGGGQLLAQTPRSQTAAGGTPVAAAAQMRYVAIGCVSRAGNGFVITDTRGEPPTAYRVEGDREQLEFHVGHTLEITGTIERVPQTAPGKPAAANAPAYTMKAEKVTYVSATCAGAKRP